MRNEIKTNGLGFGQSLIIFGSAAAALFYATHFLIPYLSSVTGMEPILFWFTVAGLGIFLPMLIFAYLMLRNEKLKINRSTWYDRLRFKKLSGADLLWSAIGIIGIGVISMLIMNIVESITGKMDSQPPFMRFEPLTPGRYWLLLVWLPYWLLNIMGEEILWRGVILPRQEIVFGNRTWLIHGLCWSVFHLAFGWQLLLTMLPILFIQPWIVQKQKNSWTGVVIHAVINGPSFVAIAFGLL